MDYLGLLETMQQQRTAALKSEKNEEADAIPFFYKELCKNIDRLCISKNRLREAVSNQHPLRMIRLHAE